MNWNSAIVWNPGLTKWPRLGTTRLGVMIAVTDVKKP